MGDVAITPNYAGFFRRFVGLIVDGIIIGVIAAIAYGVIYGILNLLGTNGSGLAGLVAFVIIVAYFIWGWGRGQTVACMLLSMKIVDQNTGEAPGYAKAAVRYVVYLICDVIFIIIIIGGLWMIWDARAQTWWDKAGGTLVVGA
jgi:uncharacterized RDD family membrane protein YckC